jgi:hypothetical protein
MEESHVWSDIDDVWLYSGPGGSGPMLWSEARARWELATGSNPVSATYNVQQQVWTVHDGQLSFELEPRLSSAMGGNPRSFVPSAAVDASGNIISYQYQGDRISEVEFGGTASSQSTVRLRFNYEDLADEAVRTSWAEGSEERIDAMLTDIEVSSRNVQNSWSLHNQVVLEREVLDATPRVVSVQQTGSDGSTTRTLATFEYEPYSGEVTTVPWTTQRFNQSVSHSVPRTALEYMDDPYGQLTVEQTSYAESWSYTYQRLSDVNGDGLPDVFEVANEDGTAGWVENGANATGEFQQLIQQQGGLFTSMPYSVGQLELPPAGPFAEEETHPLEVRRTKTVAGGRTVSVAYYLHADVDGDGRPDLIEASEDIEDLTLSWVDGVAVEAPQLGSGEFTWRIRYGAADDASPSGFLDEALTVSTPLPFPDISVSGAVSPIRGMVASLMDINGDGWKDLLYFDEAQWGGCLQSVSAYLHSGVRGGGWSDVPTDMVSPPDDVHLCSTGAGLFTDLASANWVLPSNQHPDANLVDYYGTGTLNDLMLRFPTAPTDGRQKQLRTIQDLNGDGLPDFIVAAESGWRVYVGTGSGFSSSPEVWSAPGDDGLHVGLAPSETIESPAISADLTPLTPDFSVIPIDPADPGDVGGGPDPLPPPPPGTATGSNTVDFGLGTSRAVVGLLDVDGDGLVDLVDTSDSVRWWKNLGGGFSSEQCAQRVDAASGNCPEAVWLADGLRVAESSVHSGRFHSTSDMDDIRLVVDFNHDGVLDVVDREAGELMLGSYPKPGTLVNIDNARGADTTYTYQPMSSTMPMGEPDVMQLSNHALDLVQTTRTEDQVDHDLALVSYEFEGAVSDGGMFLGFETQTTRVFEPDLGFEPQSTTFVMQRPQAFLQSRTESRYLLDRSGTFPVSTDVYTDHNLAIIPEFGHLNQQIELRTSSTTEWEDASGGACESTEGAVPRCVARSRASTTFAEQLVGSSTASATTTVYYDYSPLGLLEYVREEDTSAAQAHPIETDISWAWDDELTFAVPTMLEVTGYDVVSNQARLLERVRWSYDDLPWTQKPVAGLVSRQEVCSGPLDAPCSETLSWMFDRNDRGSVTVVDGPC